MDWRKAIFALGVAVLAGWTAFSAWVAFLSPLYTVGGVDEGWWLVCFHWLGAASAGAAMVLMWRIRKTRRQLAVAIGWLTAPLSYAAWLAFYEFYNALVLRGGGVSLPF